MKNIYKLKPHVEVKIWGGDKLSKMKNLTTDESIGETFEVSTLLHSESQVESGELLSEKINLKYLVKFIDTSGNLSVQVHPGDEYANKHESSSGKTECWLILNSVKGSGIYLGFKDGVTKEEFKTAIENGSNAAEYLNFYEVSPGDFFVVPSGAVHAIGSDVTLVEVQQSSGITYRVWDWNRLGTDGKPRQLHINRAFDVLNFEKEFNGKLKKILNTKSHRYIELFKHKEFTLEYCGGLNKEEIIVDLKEGESFISLSDGLRVNGLEVSAYESFIALGLSTIRFSGLEHSKLIIIRSKVN